MEWPAHLPPLLAVGGNALAPFGRGEGRDKAPSPRCPYLAASRLLAHTSQTKTCQTGFQ